MAVRALKVRDGSIPIPPPPPKDDIPDKSLYVSSKLTEDQKKQLVSSAEQFADILEWGGYMSSFSQAAKNVTHYRNGKGADRRLTSDEIENIQAELPTFRENKNKFLNQFLDDIARQFASADFMDACFILEEKPGDHWLGAYAKREESSKWYYAVGGFLFSFGAKAQVVNSPTAEREGMLRIRYKIYIYDRYNWDLGKDVTLPKRQIDAVDYATPGSIEPLKELPQTYPAKNYIETITNKNGTEFYEVSDSVMGSLAAAGKADFFDIRGETPEQYVNYGLPKKKEGEGNAKR